MCSTPIRHANVDPLSVPLPAFAQVLRSSLSWSQAAKFNQGMGAQIRRWIQDAEEPQEAKKLGSDYFRDPFRVRGFFDGEHNVEVMFHITLAKFQQNPKLRRWLLDTDRAAADTPILHTMERDSFWGIGPPQEDGRHRGKNWNGILLMLVRRLVLDEEGGAGRVHTDTLGPAASLARNPLPPLDPRVADADHCAAMDRAAERLQGVLARFGEPPGLQAPAAGRRLPRGALIAQRYKVVDHVFTGLAPHRLPPPALPRRPPPPTPPNPLPSPPRAASWISPHTHRAWRCRGARTRGRCALGQRKLARA